MITDNNKNSLLEQLTEKISSFERKNDLLISEVRQLKGFIDKYYKKNKNLIFLVNHINDQGRELLNKLPKATGELKKIQIVALHLLKSFNKVCVENNIEFWLHAGTLIGSIRHQGFIPWDDDIDIAMDRNNFIRLKEVIKNYTEFDFLELYSNMYWNKQYQIKFKGLPFFIDVAVWDYSVADTITERNAFLEKSRFARAQLISELSTKLKGIDFSSSPYYGCGELSGADKETFDSLIVKYHNALYSYSMDDCSDISTKKSLCLGLDNFNFPYPVIAFSDVFPLDLSVFEDSIYRIPKNSIYYLDGYGDIFDLPDDMYKNNHLYAYKPYESKINEICEKLIKNDN